MAHEPRPHLARSAIGVGLIAVVVLVAISPGGLYGLRGVLALLVAVSVLLGIQRWRRR